MSNQITEQLNEHLISCYSEEITTGIIEQDEEFYKDTGNSFICNKCKEVILNYY